MTQHIKKVDKYILIESIGRGGFGEVYKAQEEGTDGFVAIKKISKSSLKKHDGKVGELLKSEIQALKEVQSSHVVKLLNYMETANNCYLVLEYCEGGDLQSFLEKRKKFTLEESLSFLKQILAGLNALHQRQIIHRDMKMQNLLLGRGRVKICDLGFCKRLAVGRETFSLLGTIGATAPEILLESGYGYKCDFFSVGVVFYQMLTGLDPFESTSFSEFRKSVDDIVQKNALVKNLQNLGYMGDVVDFLGGMLEVEPRKRFGWGQIKNHPLLRQKTEQSIQKPLYQIIDKSDKEEIKQRALGDISNQVDGGPRKKLKFDGIDVIPAVQYNAGYMSDVKQYSQTKQEEIIRDSVQSVENEVQQRLRRNRKDYLKLQDLLEKIHQLPDIQCINTVIPSYMISKNLIIQINNLIEEVNEDLELKRMIEQDQKVASLYFQELQNRCCNLYQQGKLTFQGVIDNLTQDDIPDFKDNFRLVLVDFFFNLNQIQDLNLQEDLQNLKIIIISVLGGGFYDQWLKEDYITKEQHISDNISLLF